MSEQPAPVQKSVDIDRGDTEVTAVPRFYERRPDGSLVPLAVPREVIERAHAYLWLARQGLPEEAISLIWTSAPWERIGSWERIG
jgi:hypothetical protein